MTAGELQRLGQDEREAEAVHEPEREREISFVANDVTEGRYLESRDDRGLLVGRKLVEKLLAVHPEAVLPQYHTKTLRKRVSKLKARKATGEPAGPTHGKVALFATCYGNYNEPHVGEDLVAVFEHNNIPVTIDRKEQCCGMPKLELGDLEAVRKAKEANIPYAVIAMSTDYDCWKEDEEMPVWQDILAIFNKNVDNVKKILLETIHQLERLPK